MIKFYNLQKEEIEILKFGRVRLGDKAFITLLAKNVSEFPLIDIVFTVDNIDVKILSAPKNLKAGYREEVKLEWTPKLDSEFGLKSKISWKADELRGEDSA